MKDKKSGDRLGNRLRRITADLKLYIEKRLELTLLNIGEHISGWMAVSVHRSIGALLILGGICFLLNGLAIYLGDLLGHESLGYLIVSLPLLLVGILFIYLKPAGMFERLQQAFEAEVLKAINQNGELTKEKLESHESVQEKLEKDK